MIEFNKELNPKLKDKTHCAQYELFLSCLLPENTKITGIIVAYRSEVNFE